MPASGLSWTSAKRGWAHRLADASRSTARPFGTNGSLSGFDDGFDLRRARIAVKGTTLLAVPFSYQIELGYVPGSFTVSEAYVAIVDVRPRSAPNYRGT
jgi:hypothetical protein